MPPRWRVNEVNRSKDIGGVEGRTPLVLKLGTTWRWVVNFKTPHILTPPSLQPERDPQIFIGYENFCTLLQARYRFFPPFLLFCIFSLDFRCFSNSEATYSRQLLSLQHTCICNSYCRYNTRAYVTVTLIIKPINQYGCRHYLRSQPRALSHDSIITSRYPI